MLKRLSPLILIALLPLALASRVGADAQPAVGMSPNADQVAAARMVHGLVSTGGYHYAPQALDAKLAEEVFKRYLESLDGDRLFFTADDIAALQPLRRGIGDAIRGGQLQPAFDAFRIYQQRVGERVAHARGLLDGGFRFDADETWRYDRKDAPWAADTAELDALWTQYIKNDWLRLRLAGRKDDEIRRTLDRRYANLASRVNQLNAEDAFQTFMNAYTAAIEPHTGYMNPRTAENFNMNMRLSLEGIGAVLQRQDEFVVIRSVVPGGPAGLSGEVKPGDRISAVGQGERGAMTDVVGWRIDDVVALIRGPKDSTVRLDVIPGELGPDAEPRRISLVRQRVRLEEQAAKRSIIEVGEGDAVRRIGVITLPTFYQDFEARRRNESDYASATRDVARLLGELKTEGVDGVVMDLRNNGGGSLNEAIELTGLFIDSGPVVQVRDAGGRVNVEADRSGGVAWSGPLAVLTNRGSASASEIFAAAIQDYGRGLIIGEQTFGKGTVQNLMDLDRVHRGWGRSGEGPRLGHLKLTVAQFYRISGGSTQHKGVLPDIRFPVTLDASEFGESAYDNALPWTQIEAASFPRLGNFAPLLPALENRHQARVANDVEFGWWREDVAEYRAQRERKEISLNEAERRAERDRIEARRLAREEARKAMGIDTGRAGRSDDGLQADERDILADVAEENAENDRPDALARESAAILADAIELLGQDQGLASRVHRNAGNGRWVD